MNHQWKDLIIVASACVFLFTGSILCMNDILLPALKDFFFLSYVQSSYVQQSFFLVYLIFPIPIAYCISRFGYKISIITALFICSIGGIIMLPAFYFSSYILALTAIFVVSIVVAVINVGANSLAALLGHPSCAHVRINILQLFSRIGYLLTPIVGTSLIYGKGNSISFHLPYLILGTGTFILFLIFIFMSALPSFKSEVLNEFSILSILKGAGKYPQLICGAVTMFFYMAAKTVTASFFISYLRNSPFTDFSVEKAARFLTYYYIVTAIFALAGIFLLQVIKPGKLVTFSVAGLIILYLLTTLTTSMWNSYLLVGIGGFPAILFPTIFSLGIEGVDGFAEKGSAIINMAIVGGAVGLPLQGMIADLKSVQISYLIPCLCAFLIVLYGLYCHRRSIMKNKIGM